MEVLSPINWFTKEKEKYSFKENELEQLIEKIFLDSYKSSSTLRELVDKFYDSLKTIQELKKIPADTRIPVCSLLSHLKNCSAIATCIALRMNLTENQVLKVRLASLLHDVGKIKHLGKGKEHVEGTIEFLKKLIPKIEKNEKEFLKIENFKELIKLASRHHTGRFYAPYNPVSELEKIVATADTVSSSSDRKTDINILLLDKEGKVVDEIEECSEVLLSSTDSFFPHVIKIRAGEEILSPEKAEVHIPISQLEKPTQKYLSIGKDLTTQSELFVYLSQPAKVTGKIGIFAADIMGIQNFILGTRKLAGLIGGSLIIQELENFIEETIAKYVALEAVVLKGGGNVIAFVPDEETGKNIEEEIVDYCKTKFHGQLRVSTATKIVDLSRIMSNFGQETASLFQEQIDLKKNIPYVRERPQPLLSSEICSSCYKAKIAKAQKEEYANLCSVCVLKIKKGRNYRKELQTYLKPEKLLINEIDKKQERFINKEIITFAGKNKLNLPRELEQIGRNIAVLSIDGNMIGRFFSQTNTVAEYSYKSSYVDQKIKELIVETIKDVYQENPYLLINEYQEENQKTSSKFLGIEVLYVGGDDILIIIKSDAALIFTNLLLKKAYTLFSFKQKLDLDGWKKNRSLLTLSAGIAIGRFDFPIYFLIDKALENQKQAKSVFRASCELDKYKILSLPHGAVSVSTVYNAMATLKSHDFVLDFQSKTTYQQTLEILDYLHSPIKTKEGEITFPVSTIQYVLSSSSETKDKLNRIKFLYARIGKKQTLKQTTQYLQQKGKVKNSVGTCEYLVQIITNDQQREFLKDILPVIGE
ncbi:MAG: Cas10/Cmr2 second palm domain-containing protein [Candidatus Heimdallarchaeaceae archaeon]